MSIMDYIFRNRQKNTANIAKERLQIIVSHERLTRNGPDYLPMLQKELVAVISKYVRIGDDQVRVELERSGNCSILELNITLPDNIAIAE